LNLRFLETFVWVARLKSFSLTAEKLHTTQAAISHRIASLERELGVRLLDRNVRDVTLTPQGVDAFTRAERLVQLAAEFRKRISDTKALQGTVRIGVIESVAYTWLPTFIEQVSQRLPEVALMIDSYTSVEIAEHLRKSVLDLGLLMGPVLAPGVVSQKLCELACVWVASPNLDVPDSALDMEDIAHLRVLSYPRDSQPHATISQLIRDAGGDETRMICAPLGTMIRLALKGAGVAAIPAAAIASELQSGTLRVIKLRQPFPPIPVVAAYLQAEDHLLPALITEIAAEVASEFCRDLPERTHWKHKQILAAN
jgi:DNA-binding transcriptional LysR family regulator